jgi:hypothetical protein
MRACVCVCFVTLLLHCCCTVVTQLLHGFYSVVTVLLHGCYSLVAVCVPVPKPLISTSSGGDFTRLGSLKNVTTVYQQCNNSVTTVFAV